MGQPQPPHGPQGPFPGQPGQPPFPGQPGQQPFPGQPGQPGHYGQQAHPPGYGQQVPPPGYGQQPPQGPPGQFPPGPPPPPGFGPQGPGPGGPKKKTGLIIGGAIAAAVVLIIGGTLVSVNANRDYVAMPRDCSDVVEEDVLEEVFGGSSPDVEGRYERSGTDVDYFPLEVHGVMACHAAEDDVELAVITVLVDNEESRGDADRDFEDALRYFGDGPGELDDLTRLSVPSGEVVDYDFGFGGDDARGYWDDPSIGDRSVAVGLDDGRGDRYMSEWAVAFVQKNNAVIAVSVDYSGSARPPDVEELYEIVVSVADAVTRQLPRVADR